MHSGVWTVDVFCRQKVCERLIRTKVVQLQAELKQAAVTMIREMDVNVTLKVSEIGAARQAMMTDVMTARQMIEAARSATTVDGVNNDVTLELLSSSLASILVYVCSFY